MLGAAGSRFGGAVVAAAFNSDSDAAWMPRKTSSRGFPRAWRALRGGAWDILI